MESRSRLAEHHNYLVMLTRLRPAQSFSRIFATLSSNRLKREALKVNQKITSTLDSHLLSRLLSTTPLHTLIADYLNNAGSLLPTSLPYKVGHAIVGVMLGTRVDSRVEGLRSWGVPSEASMRCKERSPYTDGMLKTHAP